MKQQSSRQGRSAMRKAGALVFAVVASASFFLVSAGPQASADEKSPSPAKSSSESKPVPVQVGEVTNSTIVRTARFVGSLVAWKEVSIASSTAGNVTAIYVDSGQPVTENTPLFQLDDRIAKADVESAKSSLEVADHALRRSKELVKTNNISKADLDQASSDFTLAKATLQEAQARLDVLTLRAPFAGKLGLLAISNGAFVQPGNSLVDLKDNSKLYVDFQVPQRYLAELQLGQAFSLTSDAFPGKVVSGKIDFLNPSIDEQTRSLDIRGLVLNPDGALVGGVAVVVELDLGKTENAVVVPEAALVPTMTGNDVFRVVSGKAQRVPVTIGVRYRDLVEVQKGLNPGDQVVTLGQFELEDGSPVTVEGGAG